jgi:DnaJ family protein C protein 13
MVAQVWSAYKDQRHDLFLPTNAQSAAAGVAGLIEGSSGSLIYALPAPSQRMALVHPAFTQSSLQNASRTTEPSDEEEEESE